MVLIALLGTLAGCGGSGTATSTAQTSTTVTSTAAETSATTSSAATASPTGPGTESAASGVTGAFICDVIRKVQADLPSGSPAAAYQAQYTIGVAELLTGGADGTSDYTANADARARATCPSEYATFLQQSGYADLSTL